MIEEEFSSNSVVEKIILESGEDIRMEGNPFDVGFDIVVLDAIRLESGGEFDQLLLDGTNESGADAGDKVALESSEVVRPALLSEATRKITSEGQIPLENRTLNSSAKNTIGLTRSSEILVRTTGDIALEDGTVNDIDGFVGHGMLVLNGTDGSSTNAGDNFDLEGATGITF